MVVSRIERLEMGKTGDVAPVCDGTSEIKIDHGSGYRIDYKRTGKTVMLILCGGDKSTQDKDIRRAKEIAAQL
jgi:putative addiction module killer protein